MKVSQAQRVTVIGTGYLGITHAVCMAELGHDVLGLDIDRDKVERLSSGGPPIFEPGLEPLLRKHVESRRLRFTTSYEAAGEFGDVHFVCVGTPQRPDSGSADTSQVETAIGALAPHLTRRCLVVGKSTVPVGTAKRLEGTLQAAAPAGTSAELAWNPEFLREGYGIEDTLRPNRLVFGVRSAWSERVLWSVFAPIIDIGTPVVTADFATAELIKTAANSFLATKISFINAMAELCEAAGGDVTLLAEALGYDERIGRPFLNAGLGFGGGCLPKDIRAFQAQAAELGIPEALDLLRCVDAINDRRRLRAVALAAKQLGGTVANRRITVLGASFKPNSDDIRDSPALAVAMALRDAGAEVTVHDPEAIPNTLTAHPDLSGLTDLVAAVSGAELLILATEWSQYAELEPEWLGPMTDGRRILDARNALAPERWRAAGWEYRALGRYGE
ncbi:UDP-glucose/GDP-mannose dehydrogenase family protein [Streptomyces sp. PmtG]